MWANTLAAKMSDFYVFLIVYLIQISHTFKLFLWNTTHVVFSLLKFSEEVGNLSYAT